MKKNMNKKILLSLGTLSAIATPIIAVVSCGSSSDKDAKDSDKKIAGSDTKAKEVVKLSASQQKIKDILDPIFGVVMDSLDDAGKSKTTIAVETLLRSGIGEVTQEQVEWLLGVFGIDKSKLQPFAGLLFADGKVNSKLLDDILSNGLGAVLSDKDMTKKLMDALLPMLPDSVSGIITPELINKLLTGMTGVELQNIVGGILPDSIKNSPVASMAINGLIGKLGKLPIITGGLLKAKWEDWKELMEFVTAAVKQMKSLIISQFPPTVDAVTPEGWSTMEKLLNLLSMIDGISRGQGTGATKVGGMDAIYHGLETLMKHGMDSLDEMTGKEIANILNWYNNYKPAVDERSLQEYKVAVKKLFDGEFNTAVDHTTAVDTTSIDAAKTIADALKAAKAIKSYDASGVLVEGRADELDKKSSSFITIQTFPKDAAETFLKDVKDYFKNTYKIKNNPNDVTATGDVDTSSLDSIIDDKKTVEKNLEAIAKAGKALILNAVKSSKYFIANGSELFAPTGSPKKPSEPHAPNTRVAPVAPAQTATPAEKTQYTKDKAAYDKFDKTYQLLKVAYDIAKHKYDGDLKVYQGKLKTFEHFNQFLPEWINITGKTFNKYKIQPKTLTRDIVMGELSDDSEMLPKIINGVIKNAAIISKVLMNGLLPQSKSDQALFIKTVSDLAFENVDKLQSLGGKEVVKNLLDKILKVMTEAKASKK